MSPLINGSALSEAGQQPWASGQFPGTGELGDKLARTQGAGVGLSAAEHALVEARAMAFVTEHFARDGTGAARHCKSR